MVAAGRRGTHDLATRLDGGLGGESLQRFGDMATKRRVGLGQRRGANPAGGNNVR